MSIDNIYMEHSYRAKSGTKIRLPFPDVTECLIDTVNSIFYGNDTGLLCFYIFLLSLKVNFHLEQKTIHCFTC